LNGNIQLRRAIINQMAIGMERSEHLIDRKWRSNMTFARYLRAAGATVALSLFLAGATNAQVTISPSHPELLQQQILAAYNAGLLRIWTVFPGIEAPHSTLQFTFFSAKSVYMSVNLTATSGRKIRLWSFAASN
jgi:hypothetical protein